MPNTPLLLGAGAGLREFLNTVPPDVRPILWIVGLLALTLSIAVGLSAQHIPLQGLRRIFVAVYEQEGAPVLDLSPGAFDVREAGVPVEVTRASLVTEPMRIALIVDTSAQASGHLTAIRNGLHEFLRAIPPEDEVVLVGTGGQVRVRVEPTFDRRKLNSAVDNLFAEGGAPVLLDGLRESWERFLRDARDRWPVFVAIGSNGPDGSSTRESQFLDFIGELQRAAANVHIILLPSGQRTSRATAITSSLNVTKYTGGHYEALAVSTALPARMKALGEQIAAQQLRMRTQYQLDYIHQSADPQARVEVSIARSGVNVGLSAGRPLH